MFSEGTSAPLTVALAHSNALAPSQPMGAGGVAPKPPPGPAASSRFTLDSPLESTSTALGASLNGRPSGAGPLRPPGPGEGAGGIGRVLTDLRADERRLELFLRRAGRGDHMEPAELLAMQSLVYRYSQRVDLFSKLVERVTGAVRQTLQTQI
ncbi:MAG: hypothetical protein RBU30_05565 [Polyangia bacterium]|nr:hypothetical protein [Polyangia bacterium]